MSGSKERVRIAMSGGMPDRVPVLPQICPPHAIRVAGLPYPETIVDRLEHPEKYDLLVPDCAASYDVDGFRVWLGAEPQKVEWDGAAAYAVDPESGERRGSVDFNGGGGVLLLPERRRPLEAADIDAIKVVPADQLMDSVAMRPLRKAVEKYGGESFIIGAPGQFTVETLSHVQGMEATLMDMLERPDFVRQWTERQLQASIQRAIAMARIGAEAFYIGETFGQFMSAENFETLCLPYFQRFVEEVRPHGPLIYLHMCGRVTHLLDLMADTGVDCIEPLDEVGGTRVEEAARRIGDRVALMGGVSTVVLARGSVEEVREECRRCIREAGKHGGYILAAGDMLPTEAEPEKVRAMIDVACREGDYGRSRAKARPARRPAAGSRRNMKTERVGNMVVQLYEPVAVAISAPGEKRWGYHQFPTISRLPNGPLLVTFNDRPDRDDAYGTPGPAYISSDEGLTWTPWESPDPLLRVSHSVVSEVNDGDYLCVPMSPSLDIKKARVNLPAVAGTMDVYGKVLLYALKDCVPEIRQHLGALPALRWSPEKSAWIRESVAWDTTNALARTRESDYVIPKSYIDNRILRLDGDLYYPEFHQQYLLPDGAFPKNYACWCMVSKDNGRTWQKHGLIAHDPAGDLMMGEPCLFPTADGRLACVIRCADHRQKPMLITCSDDKGKTWAEPRRLSDFGVMPQALLLPNGVAVISFGRPGVHLMFSPDGKGREWLGPLSLVSGDPKKINGDSCGYTRLLPVADNSFLIAYSHFQYAGRDGQPCKAILVRKITVSHEPADQTVHNQ